MSKILPLFLDASSLSWALLCDPKEINTKRSYKVLLHVLQDFINLTPNPSSGITWKLRAKSDPSDHSNGWLTLQWLQILCTLICFIIACLYLQVIKTLPFFYSYFFFQKLGWNHTSPFSHGRTVVQRKDGKIGINMVSCKLFQVTQKWQD